MVKTLVKITCRPHFRPLKN